MARKRPFRQKLETIGAVALVYPLMVIWVGLRFTFKAVDATFSVIYDARNRYRVKTRRLRKSKPLATATKAKSAEPAPGMGTSFLHLPPEIRLKIYRIALGAPKIFQITSDAPFLGPMPSSWDQRQHIRSDEEGPSEVLAEILTLGGSPFNQLVAPPSHGCVRHSCVSELICGGEHFLQPGWVDPESKVFFTDLMRTCRTVYCDSLDVLYANNTVSLFGVEMVRYFRRNASPEGLRRVRFVHVAVIIPSDSWDSARQRRSVEGAMRTLRNSLPSLQQLDVEVVLKWDHPKDPRRLWNWLRKDVLGQFQGLERFVLKTAVYMSSGRLGPNHQQWVPPYERLSSWGDAEYQALKAKVTTPRSSSDVMILP
ncbi:hypothetical protein F4779DRAFT_305871 [Xylariaceae sp. FL0662B]|nr:hypothetical protein F4779DRAFT_305871 [Xylariaceae sp. FL0662B]